MISKYKSVIPSRVCGLCFNTGSFVTANSNDDIERVYCTCPMGIKLEKDPSFGQFLALKEDKDKEMEESYEDNSHALDMEYV